MKWVRRSAVLVLAIGLVVGFAFWWRNGDLAGWWGPGEPHGRGHGAGSGMGLGMGGGGDHTFVDDWGVILVPMALTVAAIVAVDWMRLRMKRNRRRAAAGI